MTSYRFDAPCGHGDTHPSSCGPWLDYADRRVSTAVTAALDALAAEVAGLPAREGMEYADEYQIGWADHRAAVLAAIEKARR